jgi:hypothetical protein
VSLADYGEPKGAYYAPALVATFTDAAGAEAALASLRAHGFMPRDIDVARDSQGVAIIVSAPFPGMLEEARRLLAASAAQSVRPYGSGHSIP